MKSRTIDKSCLPQKQFCSPPPPPSPLSIRDRHLRQADDQIHMERPTTPLPRGGKMAAHARDLSRDVLRKEAEADRLQTCLSVFSAYTYASEISTPEHVHYAV